HVNAELIECSRAATLSASTPVARRSTLTAASSPRMPPTSSSSSRAASRCPSPRRARRPRSPARRLHRLPTHLRHRRQRLLQPPGPGVERLDIGPPCLHAALSADSPRARAGGVARGAGAIGHKQLRRVHPCPPTRGGRARYGGPPPLTPHVMSHVAPGG